MDFSSKDLDGVGIDDIFAAESPSTVNIESEVEYYSVEYERPLEKGKIQLQMVKRHALWGNHLWNGGRWLARHLDLNPGLVSEKRVAELGAGAGLPSLIAYAVGAKYVACTDYPDRELIDNIASNFQVNFGKDWKGRAAAKGYLWGESVEELVTDAGGSFDVVFLCDVVFNHSEHAKLVKSTLSLLAATGTAFCVFTHYRPWLAEKDLAFLSRPEWAAAGWEWRRIAEERWELMFEEDRGDAEVRRMLHAHQLVKMK